MPEIPATEIANRAVADAVTAAVRNDASISGQALAQIAVKVAAAVMAGIAAVSAADERPESRS